MEKSNLVLVVASATSLFSTSGLLVVLFARSTVDILQNCVHACRLGGDRLSVVSYEYLIGVERGPGDFHRVLVRPSNERARRELFSLEEIVVDSH